MLKRDSTRKDTVLRIPLVLVWLCLFIPCPAVAWQGKILDVHDGDTVTVAPEGDATTPVVIRLYGVDAPELDQPGGDAARVWLAGQLPAGSKVEVIPYGVDRYGRALALLQRGKAGKRRTLNSDLVAAGHAWVEPRYCRAKFCREWAKLETQARRERRGLWQNERPLRPAAWRKLHKGQ